ncbi:MAG: phosphatase PAP2 family protein, partial [Ruminococcus sp.]|nr:phosphatase PAP2 family protein [Ruminococcus sp.]
MITRNTSCACSRKTAARRRLYIAAKTRRNFTDHREDTRNMLTTLTAVDFSVLDWIHQTFSAPLMDSCMVAVTHLGDAGIIWIILALLLCFFRKTRICGILILAGMLIGVLIGNVALKNIIARDRPCWIREMTDLLIAVPQDYSFPSGHTLSSFIAATVLFGFDKR